ncbi:hypothetical protein ACWAUC_12055 [Bradyrhizobium guangdongense]
MNPDDHLTATALAAIFVWPFVGLIIFAASKRIGSGLIWSFLLAQLLLPVAATVKFPMVPPIDKATIASLTAILGCLMFRSGGTQFRFKFGVVEILILASVVAPIITSHLNGDDLTVGRLFLPGVGLYDAASAAEASMLGIIPFVLGRHLLTTPRDRRNILVGLAISGCFYSIPLLFEIRFSPQLHYWIYGYYPTEFIQTMRSGGFRPMVFMGHGLLAAFYLATSLIAATTLWKARERILGVSGAAIVPYLGAVLLLCKSMGANIYGFLFSSLAYFSTPRAQMRVSVLLVVISLGYPLLRSFDLVPTTSMIGIAKSISEDRAKSLEFRFENEDRLLARAFERPVFGWGRFGRSRVYDEATGKDISVTDGRWIIDIGQFGIVGFLCEFGLLGFSVFRAAATLRYSRLSRDQHYFAAVSLLVAINIIELLPNSSLIPWTWLISGALLGGAERTSEEERIGRSASIKALRREGSLTPATKPLISA